MPVPRLLVVVAVVVYAIAAAVVATLWPLCSYTLSLAVFGLGHVLTEVRYVDARFGIALPRGLWRATGIVLAAVVALRVLGLLGVVGPSTTAPVELALVALLFAIAARFTWQRGGAPMARPFAVGATIVAVAIVGGAVAAPVVTLVVFAVLHNATPLLFLVERAPPRRRLAVALATTALFVGVPAFVATGVPQAALAVWVDLGARPWNVGVLADHLGAYLPPSLRSGPAAAQLFSAAVTAQLLHYGAVIAWLPRTLTSDERTMLRWPSWGRFAVVIVGASLGLLVRFVVDFAGARAVYGVVAAVHAWVEWPVLVASLGGARGRTRSALPEP